MQHYLKLIALRILPGCAPQIKKCLAENTFYYLCNDYTISDDGKSIKRSSKHIEPLADTFFSIDNNEEPAINLQAIVGMNGDGKSSLVEVIIRLINNLSCSYDMNPNEQLIYANGVKAELYFQSDDRFYCLSENLSEIDDCELCVYGYNKGQVGEHRRGSALATDKVKELVFYTLVSNYSHYAYNTDEFSTEWKDGHITTDESDCWLQRVFHKNDGYQSPIGLHPYRSHGNIDINRERNLSKSRLATILLSEDASDIDKHDYWGIRDKEFSGLKLTDVGYSKLQEFTINKFFNDYKYVNLLEDRIKFLKELLKKDDTTLKGELSIAIDLAGAISKSAYQYFGPQTTGRTNRNIALFDTMLRYAKKNNLLPEESDLSRLISLIKEAVKKRPLGSVFENCLEDLKRWEKYKAFNLAQIQRIELIDDICDQWRNTGILPGVGQPITVDVSPETITKAYNRLTDIERCEHYIIYKTISIFETYQEYKYPCRKYSDTALYFDGGASGFSYITLPDRKHISEPFHMLSIDWAGNSHLTIKLQQTYSYCTSRAENTRALYTLDKKISGFISKADLIKRNGFKALHIHQLPPAIYNWDLIFETRQLKEMVPYDCFSSGEKQKMNGLAAILYHIRNVDSITEATIKYESVNIILEEVELYFHPEWQRSFCNDLMGLLRSTKKNRVRAINILFVTHSPYILSDVPKSNVLFLRNGKPEYSMQENTFGANINSLLKNGFFLPSLPMGEFAHQKINELFRKVHSGDFSPEDIPALKSEILMVGEPYIRQQLMTLLKIHL